MGSGTGHGEARGKTERIAVPAMPMPLAIICCILNFLVPGLGTIIAGFSAFCCSRNEDISCCNRLGSCMLNFGIGLLQLLTSVILLLGWVWSCFWGTFFIGMSSEYYKDNPVGGGTVLHTGQGQAVLIQPGSANYPRCYPTQAQGQGQPTSFPAQPYPSYHGPPHSGYQDQGQYGFQGQQFNQGQHGFQGQPGPFNQPPHGYVEPPPPYTERDIRPSAPPEENCNKQSAL
ncbi:uncharacterized protein LOC127860008 [Dreissena polymorpha]|uniref:Protein SPEC3 n=1 Tax=Dreissena polymorpha TaxID=45954 RepID=A0A9D4S6G0_DREPO|nr:uncharacterized protein LOC127860008 [Dreissena polymorpha]KAH3893371.1 hypothetical protein DPMN_017518 [Dreissena polymorpha]